MIILYICFVLLSCLGLWNKEIRCIFYPHKMERSHPESPKRCIYCNRDTNAIHLHINKNII